MIRRLLVAALLLPGAAAAQRRAILVSLDAFAERRITGTMDAATVPAIHALFEGGACAAWSRPAFPSKTAPGHAALWTGAWGRTTGITANSQPVLPRDAHTILESRSGYLAAGLGAEPIWLAAARQGVPVFGHMVTQAPLEPGYPGTTTADGARLGAVRDSARRRLQGAHVAVLNGYNMKVADGRVVTERTHRPRPAEGWRGLETLPRDGGRAPMEISWAAGKDSIHLLFVAGAGGYDRALFAHERDVARAVALHPVPASLDGGARLDAWSAPLELPTAGARIFVRLRLFELAPDLSRFVLMQPRLDGVQANRPEEEAAYDGVVRGWSGNALTWQWERGELGTPFFEGGDGTAEARWIESLAMVTDRFTAGVEWAWRERRPRLLVTYLPTADEIDHVLWGYASPDAPGVDPAVRARAQAVRARAFRVVDRHVAALRALVAGDTAAALFVGGDHGMRPTWRVFRPNVALRAAGLLALDDSGRIDLARTKAVSSNGLWVSVNRTAWKGGIVPPDEERAVLRAAERALLAARDEAGAPIVTRIFRASEHDSLGIGGPAGGDLYWETAPGFNWSWDPKGAVASALEGRDADHGFFSEAPDMRTAFCMTGDGIRARRIGPVRNIDAAPTVAAWLGIEPPSGATGRSVLVELMGVRVGK